MSSESRRSARSSAVSEAPLRKIAIAGNPNVGKTTVFNRLTNLQQKVANYPGVTVERKSGTLMGADGIEVVDLPGTYSLSPSSVDERVAHDVLVGRMDGEPRPDAVVCVVDATNLKRNLYLVTQLLDLGLPVVVALNMMDVAEKREISIDDDALAEELGVPVVPIVATAGTGLDALRTALYAAVGGAPDGSTGASPSLPTNGQAENGRAENGRPAPSSVRWSLQPAVERAVEDLADRLAEAVPDWTAAQRRFEALSVLTSDPLLESWADDAPAFAAAVRETTDALEDRGVPYRHAESLGRYEWIGPRARRVTQQAGEADEPTLSDRIDAVLTHRVAGPLIFAGLLLLIFQAVFSWAVPAMEIVEEAVGWTSRAARAGLPGGLVEDLVVEGVIAGVGNVVVFLPQILLLFFFLGLMEDTGYMARTTFITDRLMRSMGLSGRSVVPLLSSYACAVPGIMAARTLDSERDRIITIMVAPLMSCSARLPVYTLFIAAFIPAGSAFGMIGYQGLALFALYLLGTGMALVAAWVLRTVVFTGETSTFAMELPPYRLPRAGHLWQRIWGRVRLFVLRAGKIILGASVVLWVLASFPRAAPDPDRQAQRRAARAQYQAMVDSVAAARGRPPEAITSGRLPDAVAVAKARRDRTLTAIDARAASAQVRQSLIGRFSRTIEPVMRPLGFDWKITAGIVSALAAREVIISALATLYSVGGEQDVVLREALRSDTDADGNRVVTPLVAASLMVFFVFALQCMSTLAVAKRELNSWGWPAVMWLYMFGLAYLFSLVVYQGGQALGLGA